MQSNLNYQGNESGQLFIYIYYALLGLKLANTACKPIVSVNL